MENQILKQFYFNPMRRFGVRGLSRTTKIDPKTIMKYLKKFVQKKIIIKKKERGKYPYYEANRLSHLYRHEKSEVLIKKIFESGVIEYLEKKISPKAIVLFGSVRDGVYHKKSDVDIFVQTDYKRLDLSKFDQKIGHNLNLFFEKNPKNLSRGLLHNIYNGLVLAGELEVL